MEQKEDTHHDGHTLRYSDSTQHKRDMLDRYGAGQSTLVCDIDLRLDELFPKGIPIWSDINLNRPAMWNDLMDELEETAKSKNIEMDRSGNMITTYAIPVTGYLEQEYTSKTSQDSEPDDHLKGTKWNGDYYDINYIYQYIGNEAETEGILKKVCPKQTTESAAKAHGASITGPTIKRVGYGFYNPEPGSYYNYDGISCRTNCVREKNGFIEFHFEVSLTITHIGTLGRYPRTRYFPKNVGRHRRKSNKHKSSIMVCTAENPLMFVTSYEVYYKNSEGKWAFFGLFEGNEDIQTEKINELNITTRGLKIKPINYTGSDPAMRIALYVEESEKSRIKKATETIDFTITHSRHSSLVPDGKQLNSNACGCYKCSYGHKRNQTTTTQILKEHARDTPKSFDFIDE